LRAEVLEKTRQRANGCLAPGNHPQAIQHFHRFISTPATNAANCCRAASSVDHD
jgi:hypothetical protein